MQSQKASTHIQRHVDLINRSLNMFQPRASYSTLGNL